MSARVRFQFRFDSMQSKDLEVECEYEKGGDMREV